MPSESYFWRVMSSLDTDHEAQRFPFQKMKKPPRLALVGISAPLKSGERTAGELVDLDTLSHCLGDRMRNTAVDTS